MGGLLGWGCHQEGFDRTVVELPWEHARAAKANTADDRRQTIEGRFQKEKEQGCQLVLFLPCHIVTDRRFECREVQTYTTGDRKTVYTLELEKRLEVIKFLTIRSGLIHYCDAIHVLERLPVLLVLPQRA